MINYGTIGTNWIVDSFIEAAKKTPELHLNVVYSRSEAKAAEFAYEHGVEFTSSDLECMAKSEYIDAVYIASPNSCHFEQSMLFLKNGKHVICEKPAAITEREARKLVETAKAHGVIFMEAIMSFNSPQFDSLVSAVKTIGDIRQADFSYCQLSSKYPAFLKGDNPNIFNPKMKTGALMDIGVYCVYLAVSLFGVPKNIKAEAVLHSNGIDLCGSSIFSYDDGVVSLEYSKVGNSRRPSEIIGDEGTITIDKASYLDGIRFYNNAGEMAVIHQNADDILPMQFEAKQFYEYITDFKSNAEKYEKALDLMVTVSSVMQEIRSQANIKFDLDFPFFNFS